MLAAGVSELRRAFFRHLAGAEHGRECGYLLLFYAVECGLKYAYLRQNQFPSVKSIRKEELKSTHDLSLFAKELRIPASLGNSCAAFRLKRDNSPHEIKLAHQAWRYGVEVVDIDQETLVAWLRSVASWIKELRL